MFIPLILSVKVFKVLYHVLSLVLLIVVLFAQLLYQFDSCLVSVQQN